jgi:hypothetical protein
MNGNSILQIVREVARGRLEITRENSEKGSRITIYADRFVAILVVALIATAIFK